MNSQQRRKAIAQFESSNLGHLQWCRDRNLTDMRNGAGELLRLIDRVEPSSARALKREAECLADLAWEIMEIDRCLDRLKGGKDERLD